LKGPREQLEFIAQVHLESHAVNRSLAILMQTEVRQSAKFIAEFSHHHLVKYIQVVREVVRRGQQEGIFRRDVSDGVVAHCMFGAIDETFNKFHRQVEEEFKTLKGPREQLEYIAQVHLESHAVNRSMAVLMQTEVRQSAKFIAEFSHHHLVKYIQVVREVVRRGQQEGTFRRDVSDGVVAHCMFGAIDELLSSAVFTGRVYDSKATAAQVMDVLLNGITAGK
jgi:ABC-type uncharacterized transport system permease subunit